uniref:Uncharacterized protein n=1 Tax=Parascaris equorum TaxID=6256 RepID=A0A914RWW5_PAREQ
LQSGKPNFHNLFFYKSNLQAISKLHASKAQINSVVMCMQQQLATMRMAGSLQHSTEVPEIMATMRELSREMMRIGIIDEMIEET